MGQRSRSAVVPLASTPRSNKTYVHKDVFAGVLAAINRLEAPVKKAWVDAMSEKGSGEKLFRKPFANKV